MNRLSLEDDESWLEADKEDKNLYILSEKEILNSVAESFEEEEDEVYKMDCESKPMLSDMKENLNFVIYYTEQSKNQNTFAYHNHLRYLDELLGSKQIHKTQKKIINFF